MSKLVGIKYTLYGGMGFLGQKTIFDISIDSGSCFIKYENGNISPYKYEEVNIESEKAEEIIKYAKDINLFKKVQDLVKEGNIYMMTDVSSIRIEFTYMREGVYASWSERFSLPSTVIKELDDFYDYMYELCGINQ